MIDTAPPRRRPLTLILRNFGHLFRETVILQVLSLLSGMLLTRHLQASGYGQYTFSYVFSWFLLTLLTMGTKGIILRDVPRNREKAGFYLVQVVLLRSVMAVVAIAIAVAAGWWLDKPAEVRSAMVLFMLVSATDAIALTFVETFRGLEDMSIEAWLYVSERAAVVVGVWLATRWQWGLVPIVQMMYGLALLRTVAWLIPARRLIALPDIRLDRTMWTYLIRQGWPFLRVDVAAAIVQRMDVLLLGILASEADTGRYSAAYTVYMVASVLPQILTSALQPTSARLSRQAPADLIPTQMKLARLSIAIVMPIVITFGAAAPWIMRLLFGTQFEGAGAILCWLTLGLPLLTATGIVNNHLFATDRQDLIFRVVLGNAVLNVALNLWLIPVWGAYGAVVATVVCETLVLGAMLAVSWRSGLSAALLRATAPLWAVGMAAYAVATWIAPMQVWLAAPAGLTLFTLLGIATGLIPTNWQRLRTHLHDGP